MKVAWISVYDAKDLSAYGGRGYYHPKALEKHGIDVDYIGSLEIPKLYTPMLKIKRRIYQNTIDFLKPYLPYKTYNYLFEPPILKSYAHQISKRLSELNGVDVVFSGVCQYLQPISYLDCKQPIVIWTDAPLVSAINFYPGNYEHEIAPEYLRNGVPADKKAHEKASLSIFASDWAAKIAIDRYHLDPQKVKVVPFGSNIPYTHTSEDIYSIIDSRPSNQCKLLFIGMDWQRKGGDLATQVALELNRSGLKTELTVVGCHPQLDPALASHVKCLDYISNASNAGIKRLQTLLAESHFLILPTQAETFGHVFCEANAFGVPSLATNVGGIPTIIKDDMNGKKFSQEAKVEEYCTYISDLFSDYSRYKSLALSSFYEYEKRLSWSVTGKTIKQFLAGIITSLILGLKIGLASHPTLIHFHKYQISCRRATTTKNCSI